jgi:hypothetical protein
MIELNREELKEISGGFTTLYKILFAGGIITFIIGLIDGFTRPLKCNR